MAPLVPSRIPQLQKVRMLFKHPGACSCWEERPPTGTRIHDWLPHDATRCNQPQASLGQVIPLVPRFLMVQIMASNDLLRDRAKDSHDPKSSEMLTLKCEQRKHADFSLRALLVFSETPHSKT